MGINLIANSLKHCYLASQSNLSMNQILSHLLLAASFSFRFSFLFSFLFCRYVSHGVICLLSFSFSLLVTRSSVVSWRPGSQVISNSWSLSDLCSLSSISFKSSCYHGDKKTPYFPIFGRVLTASSDVRDQILVSFWLDTNRICMATNFALTPVVRPKNIFVRWLFTKRLDLNK